MWLPARSIRSDGVIDLGAGGVTALVGCSTVSFALRTSEEQRALVAAYGRSLNSLTHPVQLLVTAERINLRPAIEQLRHDAPALPDPALERAALEHANYLAKLDDSRDLLRRRVLLLWVLVVAVQPVNEQIESEQQPAAFIGVFFPERQQIRQEDVVFGDGQQRTHFDVPARLLHAVIAVLGEVVSCRLVGTGNQRVRRDVPHA
jgi:hypothetical protein